MKNVRHYLLVSLCATTLGYCFDAGRDSTSLDSALKDVNVAGGSVDFSTEVKLTAQVRAVNADASFTYANFPIVINGNNQILNGQGNNARGFFVGGDSAVLGPGSVKINDLSFENCQVIGGTGSGGGMGAGGGLFVGKDTTVELTNCSFTNCSAVGGRGTFINSKFFIRFLGGGGMRGQGSPIVVSDTINPILSALGGGGFGGTSDFGGGGASGFEAGNAKGKNDPGGNFDGATSPAGGGIGGKGSDESSTDGEPGGFGGGGGGHSNGTGGKGGFGGGGGGGSPSGNGGFGGGGGNGGGPNQNQGLGGFGGGGGSFLGIGGFGGGNGSNNFAGNGAAFGGAIFIQDGADLTITGSINFSGNGVFHPKGIQSGMALGADIFMMSGSSITFDTTTSVFLQNPIEGNQGDERPDPPVSTSTGGIVKKGGQTLGLVGDNTYTGTTTVEGGILQVEGSLVSNVEVEGLGILLGNFDLKKDNTGANGGDLTNKGVFIASPLTTIEGLYTNESGVFQVDITPTGIVEDKIFVIGDATITGGNLEVFVGAGSYIAGTQYTLITGNVMGAFANQANPTLTGPGANDVQVQVTEGSLILTILNNNILPINPDILPIIPSQVITCLRTSNPTPGSDLALVIETISTLPEKQQVKVFETLSPRLYGSLEWINERNNSYSAYLLSQHLSELFWDCECNFNGWVTGFGNLQTNQKTIDNLPPYNADSAGVLFGVDYAYSSCLLSGFAFGYTHTDVLWKRNSGGGDLNSYYGALYMTYETGCFGTDFSVLGGGTCNDLRRHIEFATIDRNANSDFWSYFFTAHLQLRGFGFISYANNCKAIFQPFALADYHYYNHESFKEKGANSLNLNVQSKTQHMMRGEAGVSWEFEKYCECYTYAPYVGMSWVGEFPIGNSDHPGSFVGQSCIINTPTFDSTVHLASPQAGIRFAHCSGASFLLGYKGLYNSSVRINEIDFRFEWIF